MGNMMIIFQEKNEVFCSKQEKSHRSSWLCHVCGKKNFSTSEDTYKKALKHICKLLEYFQLSKEQKLYIVWVRRFSGTCNQVSFFKKLHKFFFQTILTAGTHCDIKGWGKRMHSPQPSLTECPYQGLILHNIGTHYMMTPVYQSHPF